MTKPSQKKTTLMLVDDHAVMRRGLISLLNTQPDLTVVGEAGEGETAVRLTGKLKPDVVILDLMMPEMDGVETARRMLAANPSVRILILTTFGTSDVINRAFDAGARGAVLKTAEFEELLEAIYAVAQDKRFVSKEVQQILMDDPPVPELSARQIEVLESVTRGLSNDDIARQLGISLPRVKEHVNTLLSKLGAANRAEAVAIALRKHLLKI